MLLAEALQRLGEKAHRLWQHLPLKGLGALSAALPMLAVVASAVLALHGNQSRERMEIAITRHFEMVARLNDLLVLTLNAETGLRGHLLTRQPGFLEPFALAQRSLPEEMDDLRRFVEEEPGKEPREQKRARLAQIRATVEREMTLLNALRADSSAHTVSNGGVVLSGPLVESKNTMDILRRQLRGMQEEEKTLLAQRLTEIRRVRRRDYLSVFLALFLGLATRAVVFWLFNRRVVRRVEQLTARVRAMKTGAPLPSTPSSHHDAIGELERELSDAVIQAKVPSSESPL